MTPYEYRKKIATPAARQKYGNKVIDTPCGKFDSIHEYDVYLKLFQRRRCGEITDLHRQVPFELIPAATEEYAVSKQTRTGEKQVKKTRIVERACHYVADFTYMEDGRMVVVDAKSAITRKTKEYIIKRKLMLFRYGIRIKEM